MLAGIDTLNSQRGPTKNIGDDNHSLISTDFVVKGILSPDITLG